MKTQNLSALVVSQLVVGICSAGAAWIFGSPQLSLSVAIGAALMLLNVLLLGWSWRRLMLKKSIAWTSLIIVIKYAVLLGSIFYMTRTDWFRPVGAGIGISSFAFAALIQALLARKFEEV